MSNCQCDYATGECQAPIGCKAIDDVKRLRDAVEFALMAIELHERPRVMVEGNRKSTVYEPEDLGIPGLKEKLRASLTTGKETGT